MDSLHESSPLLRASRSIRNAEHRNRSSPQVLLLALPSLLLLFSLVLLLQWNYNGLFALYGSREIPSDALSSPFLSEALPLFVRAGVYLEGKEKLHIFINPDPSNDTVFLATATFQRNVNDSGWDRFSTEILPSSTPALQRGSYYLGMRAIGFLEGYLTCREANDYYMNFYHSVYYQSAPGNATLQFLRENYEWMKAQTDLHHETDDYWFTARGILHQLEGMLEGLKEGCPALRERKEAAAVELSSLRYPTLLHLLLLNADGDLFQIADKFSEFSRDSSRRPHEGAYDAKGGNSMRRRLLKHHRMKGSRRHEHCSAMIKLLPDGSDVVFGHSTWDDYQSLGPRIIKSYSLPLPSRMGNEEDQTASFTMIFSSSPVFLSSVDDFYLMSKSGRQNNLSSSLAVMETTIDLYNTDLLQHITPQSMLSWIRARLANQLADTGAEWADAFSRDHSGTYVNQWMVLDLQRFRPLQPPILPGFLIILEELPGLIHWEDKTQDLQASGYWASYNQPYFNDIAYLSGNLDRCRDDKEACFYSDPRAIIFRERQELVVDTKSLQQLLAYNRFEFDDSSKKGACNVIACRGDLEYSLENKYPFGAIDGKVTSALLVLAEDRRTGALTLQMSARLGPTTDDQPVFCWDKFEDAVKESMSKNNRAYMHAGQPNCFNFPWQTFSLYS